ncbi:hypothetical protein HYH03_014151 [Edaphochlamys debaryana]|uniref:AP2/ERF domain-containing protein n=2 Tax=Edaphochlamys debaryana TaxID=47281 RepID=A0A835XPB7_9CHLO|nr:hypothetical protein HYH03_014151 [Edaphochlamys debaryana]|eukprot:KAG2487170.1 hypothetical protein HYH03_014151 [Edaphochlamys debaryana]
MLALGIRVHGGPWARWRVAARRAKGGQGGTEKAEEGGEGEELEDGASLGGGEEGGGEEGGEAEKKPRGWGLTIKNRLVQSAVVKIKAGLELTDEEARARALRRALAQDQGRRATHPHEARVHAARLEGSRRSGKASGARAREAARKVKAGEELTEEEARAYEALNKGRKAANERYQAAVKKAEEGVELTDEEAHLLNVVKTTRGKRSRETARKVREGEELTEAEARHYEFLQQCGKALGTRFGGLHREVAQKVRDGIKLTAEEQQRYDAMVKGLRAAGATSRANHVQLARKAQSGLPMTEKEAAYYTMIQAKGMRRENKRDLPRGVYLVKKSGRFQAAIMTRRQRKCLGSFDTPEEAARAFDEAAIRRWQAGLVPELVTNYPPEGYPEYTGVVRQAGQEDPWHRTLAGESGYGHTRHVTMPAARKAQQAAGGAEEGQAPAKVDGRGKVTGARIRAAAEKLKAGLELTEEERRAYEAVSKAGKAGGAAAGASRRAAAQKAKAGLELTEEEARAYAPIKAATAASGALTREAARKVKAGLELTEEEAKAYQAVKAGGAASGVLRREAAQKAKAGLQLTEEEASVYEGGRKHGDQRRVVAQKVKAGLELTEEERKVYESYKRSLKAASAAFASLQRAAARKIEAGLQLTEEEARAYNRPLMTGAAVKAAAQKVAEGAPLSPKEAGRYQAAQMAGLSTGGKRDLPRGVGQSKSGRYMAQIACRMGGVRSTEYLGTFATPEEAARAFDEAAIRRWQAGLVPELVTNYHPRGTQVIREWYGRRGRRSEGGGGAEAAGEEGRKEVNKN